jgi:hypothetical protein
MSISVVFIIKNGIKNGYCFWESLLSSLNFADELIVSEGYSEDKTYDYIKEFVRRYKDDIKINLFRDEWEKESYHGEVISKVSERAIVKARCDFTYLLQADEVIADETAQYIVKVSKIEDINSVCFPFYHFLRSWVPSKGGYDKAIRMVRRGHGKLKGDGFTFFGNDLDPVYQSKNCPKPIAHFAWCFPNQNIVKDIEHYKIYTNITEYKEKMIKAAGMVGMELPPYPLGDFNDFPELARRFIGKAEYSLPFRL